MNDGNGAQRDGVAVDGGTGSVDRTFGFSDDGKAMGDQAQIEEQTWMTDENREFLLEAVRRAPLLWLLQEGAATATTLSESVDMSRSTVHRAVNSLEDADVIAKRDDKYELTHLGTIIADVTRTFSTQTSTALDLAPFVNSIQMNGGGFPVEYFSCAAITQRTARNPHATIHRITELIEQSESLQMFSTVISPVYVDVGYREMMDGMKIEAIFEREVVELMLSEYPQKAYETISTGNFTVYEQDGLPFELFLFDDRIGMAAHNQNGNAEILIECDAQPAIEWAESLYARHHSDANALQLE